MDEDPGGGGAATSPEAQAILGRIGDPPAFPDDAVTELYKCADAADLLYETSAAIYPGFSGPGTQIGYRIAVDGVVDAIHSIIGNHEVARILALNWGTCVTPHDVKTLLGEAKQTLDGLWKGEGAKASFDTYFDSVSTELDVMSAKVAELSNVLVDAIRWVYEAYGAATGFLIKAAADASLFFANETVEAIHNLIVDTADLIEKKIIGEGNALADATMLTTVSAQFTAPQAVGGVIDDSNLWHVQPTSGH